MAKINERDLPKTEEKQKGTLWDSKQRVTLGQMNLPSYRYFI